jgi:hypothetical protein
VPSVEFKCNGAVQGTNDKGERIKDKGWRQKKEELGIMEYWKDGK